MSWFNEISQECVCVCVCVASLQGLLKSVQLFAKDIQPARHLQTQMHEHNFAFKIKKLASCVASLSHSNAFTQEQ